MSSDLTARGTEPFVGVDGGRLVVTLPAGDGRAVQGQLTPEQARDLTRALRSCAASVDDKPFLAGGWHDRLCAERLEQLTDYYVDEYGTDAVDKRYADAAERGGDHDGD